jgi:hypothetical protein
MNTQVNNKNRDRQYKVILFLLIGLAVTSSVVRDLNQLRLAVRDTSELVSVLSDKLSPAVVPANADVASCVATNSAQNDSSLSQPDILSQESNLELNPIHGNVIREPSINDSDQLTTVRRSARLDKSRAHANKNVDEADLSLVIAQALKKTNGIVASNFSPASNSDENGVKPETTDWRKFITFKSTKGWNSFHLPVTVNTQVDLRKLDGFTSEFPMDTVTIRDRKRMKRTGATGRQLLLKTSNGTINVRAAS